MKATKLLHLSKCHKEKHVKLDKEVYKKLFINSNVS